MRITDVLQVRLLVPVLALLISAGCGGGGDGESAEVSSPDRTTEIAGQNDTATAETPAQPQVEVPDACVLFDHMELEQMLGWELYEGDPDTMPPGLYACDFSTKPLFYVERTYQNPALPESIGFNSLKINTYPQSAKAFIDFREMLAAEGEDVSGIGDGAYFYGFDMLYVRVGEKAFSLRIYTDAQTDADRALVREVMLTLAREGVAKFQ